jgi:hypothetical protein
MSWRSQQADSASASLGTDGAAKLDGSARGEPRGLEGVGTEIGVCVDVSGSRGKGISKAGQIRPRMHAGRFFVVDGAGSDFDSRGSGQRPVEPRPGCDQSLRAFGMRLLRAVAIESRIIGNRNGKGLRVANHGA